MGQVAIAIFATLISVAFGQTFEVASVKPSGPPGPGPRTEGVLLGGPGTPNPERVTDSRTTLQLLIGEAYGVAFDQIQGPGWIADERYDIIAKVPPGSTKEQLKLMLQNLLEERFKLAFHRITKTFPVYELTIAKGGSKLKENNDALEPSRPGDWDPSRSRDRDGFLQLPPGKSGAPAVFVNGLHRITAQGVPLSVLFFELSTSMTGRNTYAPGRIVDKTGLTGKYDFRLAYASPSGIGSADGVAMIGLPYIEAVEQQLGLKLTKSTAPFDVLVIDHAQKTPTEN